jgi:hypothetical protein
MTTITRVLTIMALTVLATVSQADLLTSAAEIPVADVITFESETPVADAPGPIQIGGTVGADITVSGNPSTGFYVNSTSWGLLSNGSWTQAKAFVGANDARPGTILISFNDGPVAAVGGFINHAPSISSTASVTAYDVDMNVLETYDVTSDLVTPSGIDEGRFRGISRPVAEIVHFEFLGGVPVLDDLTFSAIAAEPAEPAMPVPTLGIWSMLALIMFLLIGSMIGIHRTRLD